jgi:NADH dehydrogenase
MNIPTSEHPRVVIIGGGFAGLELAKQLKDKAFQVVILDRHNYHTFQPLLYQVATAGLEPDSIAYPLRKILRKSSNLFFRMAEVNSVEPEKKCIHTNIGKLQFDHLVIASGSKTNYFGNKEIEKYSMPMKSVPQALDIRSALLQNLENALNTSDINERHALMSVVLVGGGPTGVELAGALAELKNHVLPSDYPDLDVRQMDVHIIEASPKLLNGMSDEASDKAREFLEDLNVKIWLNTMVTQYDGKTIKTQNGKSIESKNLIWAAGVKGSPVEGLPQEALLKNGRISVDEKNVVLGTGHIFAIGDVAQMENESFPHGHPMLAQVAIQQGRNLAKNLIRSGKGTEMKAFVYKDPGTMATVGRNKAVVDLPNWKTQGALAWLIWMLIHVMALVGFRNKLIVLANWAYNYWKYQRDIRLIIRPYRKED